MTVERESCLIKPVLLLPGWGTAAWQPGSSCPLLCSVHSPLGAGAGRPSSLPGKHFSPNTAPPATLFNNSEPPGPAAALVASGLEAFSQRCNLTAPVGMFTAHCHLRAYQHPPYLPPLQPDKPRCWWQPGEAPTAGDGAGSKAGGAAALPCVMEDAGGGAEVIRFVCTIQYSVSLITRVCST